MAATWETGAQRFFGSAADKIAAQLTSLIGKEVRIRPGTIETAGADDLAAKLKGKAALLLLEHASGDGKALVLFRLPEAILFAASLLMFPASQIKELHRKDEMGQDLSDAFSEVANITYGALDDLCLALSPENGKLRTGGIQLLDPSQQDGLRSLWPAGPASVAELGVEFPEFETNTVFLVFEEALLSLILGIPSAAGSAPADDVAAGERPSTPVAVLVYGRTEEIMARISAFLSGKGLAATQAADTDTAMKAIAGSPILVFAEFAPEGEDDVLRICRAAVDSGRCVPVVGVSANPTRAIILRARDAGVRAFLVHPFSEEILCAKTEPFLSSAGDR